MSSYFDVECHIYRARAIDVCDKLLLGQAISASRRCDVLLSTLRTNVTNQGEQITVIKTNPSTADADGNVIYFQEFGKLLKNLEERSDTSVDHDSEIFENILKEMDEKPLLDVRDKNLGTSYSRFTALKYAIKYFEKLYSHLCEEITPNRKADQEGKEAENFPKQIKEKSFSMINEMKTFQGNPELNEENKMVKVNPLMGLKIQEDVKQFGNKNEALSFPRGGSIILERLLEQEERVTAYFDLNFEDEVMQSIIYEKPHSGKVNLNPLKVEEKATPRPKIMAFVNVIEVFKEYDGRPDTDFNAWLERSSRSSRPCVER